MNKITVVEKSFELATPFGISRDVRTSIDIVEVNVEDSLGLIGRGECRPYPRYGETPQSVIDEISAVTDKISEGINREDLKELMPANAARNAVDCALWDLEAKQQGKSVWQLLGGTGLILPVPTVQTLSLSTPFEMASSAQDHAHYKTLKVKLGGNDLDLDIKRLKAINEARPDASLVLDANEGWTIEALSDFVKQAQGLNVRMIEQPLPQDQDTQLIGFDNRGIIICGDESIHDANDMRERADRYDMMNIKLDKAGGLTHAFEMLEVAKELETQVMVGCMVSSSLAIEPAILLAQNCDLADLDGSWWLKEDYDDGVTFKEGHAYSGTLWGHGLS